MRKALLVLFCLGGLFLLGLRLHKSPGQAARNNPPWLSDISNDGHYDCGLQWPVSSVNSVH